MFVADQLKPFAEESGFSDTLEGYLKDTVSVLELFKAAQSYPHESALKKQCSWTKQYLEMELSNWLMTSVRDKYLKKEVTYFAYLSSCESYLRILSFSG